MEVRSRLAGITHGPPLGVTSLREGIPAGEWPGVPDQPYVMVSTVDDFGSKVLFRGRGVTSRMRSVYAGLAGNDCLVILDDIGLGHPLVRTLEAVGQFRRGPLPYRYQVVQVGSPDGESERTVFKMLPGEVAQSEELSRRLHSPKRVQLVSYAGEPEEALPSVIAKLVGELPPDAGRIGIIANRLRTARNIHRRLGDSRGAILLTGRMRPVDRLEALAGIPASRETTLVVSTQAAEADLDIDFDGLITECAPVDALRRRFAKLDPRGERHERTGAPSPAWIVGSKSKNPDPVYGEASGIAWGALEKKFGKNGAYMLEDCPPDPMFFPEGAVPVQPAPPLVLTSHMAAWSQTQPSPVVDPPIEPFLRGIGHTYPAEVSVVWRHDPSASGLRLVPPRPSEYLSLPLNALKNWLMGKEEPVVADVDSPPVSDGVRNGAFRHRVHRWQGFRRESLRIRSTRMIRSGDIFILDPAMGGLRDGSWDPGSDAKVEDIGDQAQLEHGARATLNTDPRVHPQLARLADTGRKSIAAWMESLTSSDPEGWLGAVLQRLEKGFVIESGEAHFPVIRERRRLRPALGGSDRATIFTGVGTLLSDHLEAVGNRASEYARGVGMPSSIMDDMRLAGNLHDIGLVDTRCQAALLGYDPVEIEMQEAIGPLGKSPAWVKNKESLPGAPHSLMAVSMAQSNPEVLAAANDPDLVLHLVATHHGYGRPIPQMTRDPDPQVLEYSHQGMHMAASTDLAEKDSPQSGRWEDAHAVFAMESAERFWRLTDRYGYHGLAWLETIFRLAEHRQSAEESRR